jgi:ribonucleotide reductase alpha subunit
MTAAVAQRASRIRRSAQNELSRLVWESRYRYAGITDAVPERSIDENWDRVAAALARVEAGGTAGWRRTFCRALADFKFLPGGRVLAGAGAATTATLANCFVTGSVVTAADVAPNDHLAMLAALQPLVDSSISKTINVPESTPQATVASIFRRAYAPGVKGCTVFRANAVTGAVLSLAACCARPQDHV